MSGSVPAYCHKYNHILWETLLWSHLMQVDPSPSLSKEAFHIDVVTHCVALSVCLSHSVSIYLTPLSPSSVRMRKRPESGSIRRTFRGSESECSSPGAAGGGVRTASLPVGGALVKEGGDKRPVSAHSILNSVTRHSSLKTKVRLSNDACFF